jgi:hypothetical protein
MSLDANTENNASQVQGQRFNGEDLGLYEPLLYFQRQLLLYVSILRKRQLHPPDSLLLTPNRPFKVGEQARLKVLLIVVARTGTFALVTNLHHYLWFRSLLMACNVIHNAGFFHGSFSVQRLSMLGPQSG